MVSIARTLALLTFFENNFVLYLADNEPFVFEKDPRVVDDSPVGRMAFLLYLMSYEHARKGLTSYNGQTREFLADIQAHCAYVAGLLSHPNDLRNRYRRWMPSQRFHKRLWASFRDYVKPGSTHRPTFAAALKACGADSCAAYLDAHLSEALCSLELPGDLWNNKFFEYTLEEKVTPSRLRYEYNILRGSGAITADYYPEQFDVTFVFAQEVCARSRCDICPFNGGSRLTRMCADSRRRGAECDVIFDLLKYEHITCRPETCPVLGGTAVGLCKKNLKRW